VSKQQWVRVGQYLVGVGVGFGLAAFIFWFIAIWLEGPVQGKVGGTGALLCVFGVIVGLVGSAIWGSNGD
jgi:uncharacterized membrane protein